MPYLSETMGLDALRSIADRRPPFGPGFSPGLVGKAIRMEVWYSSVLEDGQDYVRFKLFTNDGNVHISEIGGY